MTLATLHGRRVLLVHEDAFQSAYLADVIAGSGGTIVGVVSSPSEGIALLEQVPPPCALVLSGAIRGEEAVAHVAAIVGAATLLVQPVRPVAVPPDPRIRVLSVPFAGFQVVDAIAQMLAEPAMRATPCVGPQNRGH